MKPDDTENLEYRKIHAVESDEGGRLDQVISNHLPDFSRSKIQNHITDGKVKINGEIETSKKKKVTSGMEIEVAIEDSKPLDASPEDMDLNIIYEDDDLLIVDKPAGMVVHPAPGNPDGTLVNGLLAHTGKSLSSINGVIRPGIVHRIDKDTSGLLVVAKNDISHQGLSEQLSRHDMKRVYKAIVYNNLKSDQGTIDAPLKRDPKNRLKYKVIDGGKEAITHYDVDERFGNYTYVELQLETGRTHQIRVHMSHIGHPLLGDPLYGPKVKKKNISPDRQMLHAASLGFKHPRDGRYMEFESPLPADFSKVLSILRKR